MSGERDANVAILQGQILDYLKAHPHAADSREGIARWWLADRIGGATPETLQAALDDLVDRGLVCCRQAAGGEPVYSRAESSENGEPR